MPAEFVLQDRQLVRLAALAAQHVIDVLDESATPAPPTLKPPRLALQRREAAAALSVGVDTFDRHIRPMLKGVYVGDLRLWPVTELERYLDENARSPCHDEPHNIKRPPRRANARGPGTRRFSPDAQAS